jgi:hypothetical protein
MRERRRVSVAVAGALLGLAVLAPPGGATGCELHVEHDGPHERSSCGLERLGQVEVSPDAGAGQLEVRGGLAAVVQREDGRVALVDVRDPAAPRVVGRYDGGTGRPELDDAFDGDVAFSADGRHLFHAHQTHQFSNDGLHVVDVSDPTAPRRTAYVPMGGALRVAAHADATGEYVVVLDAVAGLVVLRFEPTTGTAVPVHVDALPALKVGGPASAGLWIDRRDARLGVPLLYVTTGKGGLDVYDLSSPAAPRKLGSWAGEGLADVVVRSDATGRTVLAATEYWFNARKAPRLVHLDATDLGAITRVRQLALADDAPAGVPWRLQGLALGPHGLHVAHSHAGMGVFDLADLEGAPVAATTDLGEANPAGELPGPSTYAMDAEVVGDVVWVTDASTGTLTSFRRTTG